MPDDTKIGGGPRMRGLEILAVVWAAFLLQACGGNEPEGAPAPATVTATPQMDSSEIVALAQDYQVAKWVETSDGLRQMTVVSLASRVEEYCSDSPRWSTREGQPIWRVFAECTKEHSVPGDRLLRFEWVFYPDSRSVWPFNHPAHVAQYQYPWEQEPEY